MEQNTFTREMELTFGFCDPKKQAKLSAVNGILSDFAGSAFAARGMDHRCLLEHGYVFFLSKVSLKMLRMPAVEEKIQMSTWEKGTKGAVFLREFQIDSANGESLLYCKSEWILVKPDTRQIIRPSDFTEVQILNSEKASLAADCKRLRMKNGSPLGSRKVRYSDLDGNGHVYNAVYSAIAVDMLPAAQRKKALREFQINYLKECVLEDELELFYEEIGEEILIKGTVLGQDCFICAFSFDELNKTM